MSMQYSGALGGADTQFASDQAKYTFATPTDGNPMSLWPRGIWFTTDDFGNSPGITCQSIGATNWRYHAYVISLVNPAYIYNVGQFGDPNAADNYNACNGAGGPVW